MTSCKNTLDFVLEVQAILKKNQITTWIFGGWAKELWHIIPPRPHKDVDLLYPAENFNLVDDFLTRNPDCIEIKPKHFMHKRAFNYKGIMVELFLVNKDGYDFITNFWGTTKYIWPRNILSQKEKLNVASKEALTSFDSDHDSLKYIPEIHAVE